MPARIIHFSIEIPRWLDRLAIKPVLLYRRLRYGYPFCRIPLTMGKFAIVDPDDFFELSRHKWQVKGDAKLYATRAAPREKGKLRHILMHREILNVPAGMVVDHINHNGLDNRKANLRPATFAQNAWSARRRRPSGYRGVSFDKRRRLWRATISYCGKSKHLGHFKDKVKAAKAYDKAARKYHGDFATLNFPELTTNKHE